MQAKIRVPREKVQEVAPIIYRILLRIKREEAEKAMQGGDVKVS